MTDHDIARAKSALDHGCDGPITAFVLISRATSLVSRNAFPPDVVANALHDVLTEFAWLRTVEAGVWIPSDEY